jgi:hypothetical protein
MAKTYLTVPFARGHRSSPLLDEALGLCQFQRGYVETQLHRFGCAPDRARRSDHFERLNERIGGQESGCYEVRIRWLHQSRTKARKDVSTLRHEEVAVSRIEHARVCGEGSAT